MAHREINGAVESVRGDTLGADDERTQEVARILRFVEDNWSLGRIGNQSFDALAGSLGNMFDFSNHRNSGRLFLDPSTGN